MSTKQTDSMDLWTDMAIEAASFLASKGIEAEMWAGSEGVCAVIITERPDFKMIEDEMCSCGIKWMMASPTKIMADYGFETKVC